MEPSPTLPYTTVIMEKQCRSQPNYISRIIQKNAEKIDTVEDILKQCENQTLENKAYTYSEYLNNVPTRNSTSDTWQRKYQKLKITKEEKCEQ